MATKNTSGKKNTAKQSTGKRNVWAGILGIILSLLLIFGGGVGGYFMHDLLKKDDQQTEQPDTEDPDDKKDPDKTPDDAADVFAGGMELEDWEGDDDTSLIKLTSFVIPHELYADYGVDSVAETAIQVTATVTPDDAVDGELDWHLPWKDAESEWANGKNPEEYVQISVSPNTLSATLTCLQAFGEPLLLSASIKTNASVASSPRAVHYVQGYNDLAVSIAGSPTGTVKNLKAFSWSLGHDTSAIVDFTSENSYYSLGFYYADPTYIITNTIVTTSLDTVYTKPATVGDVKFEIAPTSTYVQVTQENGFTLSASAGEYISLGIGEGAIAEISSLSLYKLLMLNNNLSASMSLRLEPLKRELKNHTAEDMLNIRVTTTVNDVEHTKVYSVKFDLDSLAISASGVGFTDGYGDIDFGG